MKKNLFTSIIGGFLFLLICSRFCSISLPPSSSMLHTPSSAYETVLDYGTYTALYANGVTFDAFWWNFTSSNSSIGITVMAMNSNNYTNFVDGYAYMYFSLSTGAFASGFGFFYLPYPDIWYLVFLNIDSDMQSITLKYEGVLYTAGKSIDITSPSSSDTWSVGTWQYIYYDVISVAAVDIFLYLDGVYLSTIATNQETTGSFHWFIPDTLYQDSNYQIYIQDHLDSLINDTSDAFTIENDENLFYNDYRYWGSEVALNTSDFIKWEFISSNPNVGIRVYAMDSPNFINFTLGEPRSLYYTLCLNETEDKGLFRIPYDEIWYILFNNYDPDFEPTILTWNVTLAEYTDDEFEENDDYTEAAAISEGSYMNLASLDSDWYSLDLNAGDTITIDLYFIHDDGDINVGLRDKYGNWVDSSETTTDHEHIEYTAGVTNTYQIHVYHISPNPTYDMIIDISTGTTTTTTTSTTDTNTAKTTSTSDKNPFGFKISGYLLTYFLGSVIFGLVTILYRRKSYK